jgi:hypothetical protein
MFHPFAYDEQSRTCLARFSGTLTEQDLVVCDVAARACLTLHGPVAGLVDFSHVDSVEVTAAQIISRGMGRQIMVGQRRAIVANGVLFGLMRMFSTYQSQYSVEPMIMRTLPEAYAALGLVAPDFQPVALSMPCAATLPAGLSSVAPAQAGPAARCASSTTPDW